MGDQDELLVSVEDGVATLTINRPERRNAMSWTVLDKMRTVLANCREDPAVRVVVLTGAGDKAFCAGADLGGMRGPSAPGVSGVRGPSAPGVSGVRGPSVPGVSGTGEGTGVTGTGEGSGEPSWTDLHHSRGQMALLFRDLWELGMPTIARVRGYALAGGFGLALACDLVVAAEDAQFGTPEIDVGLWPYMITVPLVRSMPPKVALELMMTGRRLDAAEAQRIGFVNRVVPVDELDAAVAELAGTLARKPPEVMRLGRSAFYAVWDQSAEDALRMLHPMLTVTAAGDEAAEGIAAFAEKRPPNWAR